MCPTYTYRCEKCDQVTDGFFRLTETRPDELPCIVCGESATYELASPLVMRNSHPDGVKRKGWADLKEASKLNRAVAGTDNLEEKAALKREIKKTGFSFGKED